MAGLGREYIDRTCYASAPAAALDQPGAGHPAEGMLALQYFTEVVLGDAGVLARDGFRTGALATTDRIQQAAVLVLGNHQDVTGARAGRALQHECVGRGEGQGAGALDLAQHQRASGHLRERGMKASVQFDVGREALRGERRLGEQLVDPGDAVGGLGKQPPADTALGRHARGKSFQSAAQLDRVVHVALGERLGGVAAGSERIQQTFLLQLQQEGLLDTLAAGGYTAKAFTESDVHDAIELRGTLEGLAARMAAERGVGGGLLAEAADSVAGIDELLAQPALTAQCFATYVELNGRFHAALAEMAGSALVLRQIERASTLPFASPNAFVLQRSTGPRARDVLVVAQDQHRGLLDAIRRREGARAESIAREHARIAQHNLGEVLQSQHALGRMPGAGLIKRRSRR